MKQGSELQSTESNPRVSAFLTPQQMPVTKKDETHLFLKFSALALPVNEPCELFFFIYDAKQQKVLRCEEEEEGGEGYKGSMQGSSLSGD